MPDSRETSAEGANKRQGRSQPLSQANSSARTRRPNTSSYHDIATSLFSGNSGDLEELFLAAARDGDYDRILNFLQRRGDILVSVDVKDKRTGNTPLIWAAKRGHSKIVQLLLRHGADVTLRNYDNKTALEVASPAIKQVLLDSIHRSGSSHQHLLQAAWQGNIEVVRKILSEGKALDIDCRNSDGLTPMLLVTRDVFLFEKLGSQLVSSYDPLQVVQELITHRADVNAIDPEGRTPLHYTSSSKSTSANDLATYMLSEGSNADIRDKRCFTPIHCASQSGNVEVVLALLHNGSDPNTRGFAGATPLHITAYNGHERVAMALLENGADVTMVDDSGRTPLDVAVSKKVKSTLKQAWVEATQVKKEAELTLRPIRNGTKSGSRKSARKRGEVIFDLPIMSSRSPVPSILPSIRNAEADLDESLVNQSASPRQLPKKLTPLNHDASPRSLTADTLNAEWDALNIQKALNREGPRRLGEPRGRPPKMPNTPEKSPTKTSDHRSLTPLGERPVSRILYNRSASDITELENTHQRLAMRKSDPVRKFAATPTGVSHLQVTVMGLDLDNTNMRVDKSAWRRYSEPQATSFSDLAASCDDMLARGRQSVFSPERSDSASPPPRLTPLRTPSGSDRRRMKIPDTIDEDKVANSKPVILDLDQMKLTQSSGSPLFIDYSSLYPGRRIPATPSSQGRVSSTRLIDLSSDFGSPDHSPEDSSKDSTPRSDSNSPQHSIVHKENFNIEDTRILEKSASNRSSVTSSISDLTTPSPINTETPRRLSLPPMGGSQSSTSKILPKTSQKSAKPAQVSKGKSPEKTVDKNEPSVDKLLVPGSDKTVQNKTTTNSARSFKASSPHGGGRKEPGGKSIDNIASTSQTARLRAQAKVNAVSRFANVKKAQNTKSNESLGNESSNNSEQSKDNESAVSDKENPASPPKNKVTVHSNLFVTEVPESFTESVKPNYSITEPKKDPTAVGASTKTVGAVVRQNDSKESNKNDAKSQKGKPELKSGEENAKSPSKVNQQSGPTPPKPTTKSPRDAQKGDQKYVPVLKRQISSTSVASGVSGSYPVKGQTEKNTSLTKVSSTIISDHPSAMSSPRAGAMKGSTTSPRKVLQRAPSKDIKCARQAVPLIKTTTNAKLSTSPRKAEYIVTKTTSEDSKTSIPVALSQKEMADNNPASELRESVENTIKESQQTRALLDHSFQTFAQALKPSGSDKQSKNSNTDLLLHAIELLENVTKEYEKAGEQKVKLIEPSVTVESKGASQNSSTKSSSQKLVKETSEKSDAKLPAKSNSGDNKTVATKSGMSRSVPSRQSMSIEQKVKSVDPSPVRQEVKRNQKQSVKSEPQGASKNESQSEKTMSANHKKGNNAKIDVNSLGNEKQTVPISVGYNNNNNKKTATVESEIEPSPKATGETPDKTNSLAQKSESPIKVDKKAKSTKLIKKSSSVSEIAEDIKKAVTDKKSSGRNDSNLSPKARSASTSSVEPKQSNISPRKTKTTPRTRKGESLKNESGYMTQSDTLQFVSKECKEPAVIEELTPLDITKAPPIEFADNSSDLKKTVNINFLEHTGPVIEDAFENFQQPESTIIQNRETTKTHELSTKGKGSSQKQHLFQFSVGKSSRENSAKSKLKGSSRRSSKTETSVTSSNKRTSNTKSPEGKTKKPVGERKKRNVRRRKKKGQGQIILSEHAESPTTALISGIGWHIETHCNDKSDVMAVEMADSSDEETPRNEKKERSNKFKEILPGDSDISKDKDAEKKLNAINKMLDSDSSTNGTVHKPKKKVLSADRKKAIREILERYRDFGGQALIPQTLHAIKEFSMQVHDSDLDRLLGLDHSGDSLNTDSYCSLMWNDDSFDSIKQTMIRDAMRNDSYSLETEKEENITQVGEKDFPLRESDDDYVPMSEHDSEFSSSYASEASSRQSSGQSKVGSGKKTLTDQLKELRQTSSQVRELTEESIEPSKSVLAVPSGDITTSDNENKGQSVSQDLPSNNEQISKQDTEADITADIETNSPETPKSKQSFMRSLSDSWTTSSKSFREKTFVELKNSPPSVKEQSETPSPASKDSVSTNSKTSSYNETNPELMQMHHPSEIFEKLYVQTPAESKADISQNIQPAPSNGEPSVSKNLASLPPRPKSSKAPRPVSSASGRPVVHHRGSFSEIKVPDHLRDKDLDELSNHPSLANSEAMSEMLTFTEDVDENVFTQKDVQAIRAATPESRVYTSRLGRRSASRAESVSTQDSDIDKVIQWKKGNLLGKGAYGMVWCGLTNDGELIAVKQIDLNIHNWEKAEREYEKIQEEVDLLKNLRHRNIVGFLGTALDDSVVSIFMQFIPGGSIATVLARFGALEESVFSKYTKQILEGVAYIHENNVIHRDIKGGNIMLMPNGVIKLIDFGCAKRLCLQLSASQSEILKSMRGTPFWMAPEVIMETGHGKKSDVWSIGCTVFEMATKTPPWSDMAPLAAIFAIGQGNTPAPTLPDKFSEEARIFVSSCLIRDQNQRPSACELLEHPFITRRKQSTS